MERILVDMDGVLVDVYNRFFHLYKESTGKSMPIKDIIGLKEAEAFPEQIKWVNSPGFFRNMPVMKDSQKVLQRLNEKFDIVIASMATEFPQSLTDKQLWLVEYFPFITWKQVVFCGRKNIIEADIMIDDHLKNLDNFEGETFIFSQPHNMNLSETRHRRVNSWKEIEEIFIGR